MKIICVDTPPAFYNKETLNPLIEKEPAIFLKTDSSILKDGKPFFVPDFSSEIYYEMRLVVKIDRLGKNIATKFAHRYYNEITVGIDFTAIDLLRALQFNGMPWDISKTFDYSAVVGKYVSLEEIKQSINQVPFHLNVNGTTTQEGDTSDMSFKVDEIIAYVSRFFTLKTGDLIYLEPVAKAAKANIHDHLEGYIGDRKLLDFLIK
ncbi:MAG: fumarylacetoacetate hydrolase family protein [Dysgonamonadaceae bacterium]|jgi:2-keto-4-pentenoate hydratase/2-oxohepta-3-ene-1,7-dioic acid hydratase in catechol pathway|nr:fumarylacetoacetate hydrolase family protein [Dysgonamonadaceae bacterium]